MRSPVRSRSAPPDSYSQILIRCIWLAAIRKQHDFLLLETMAPTQRQAIQPFWAGFGRFHEPQGSGFFSKKEEANDV
jgi:hypothetical protein